MPTPHDFCSWGYAFPFSDADVCWVRPPFETENMGDMCGLSDYKSAKDAEDWWTSHNCGLGYCTPCMSTGAWDLNPTVASKAYLECVMLEIQNGTAWEQQIANRCLVKHHEAMHFRIWSKATHANVGVIDKRRNQLSNMSLVHLGYVHGKDKVLEYEKRSLFVEIKSLRL